MAQSEDVPEGGPPSDPEEWTDEEWLTWLVATDVPEGDGPEEKQAGGPVTAVGKLKASSGGQVLGQAMTGLANALSGEKRGPSPGRRSALRSRGREHGAPGLRAPRPSTRVVLPRKPST